ncbi:M12 family metallo-peptidase [Neolewinella persica]|uniref:M12 family metallo-peptidase n=1 Tax=Neolewinella persica TaxID=70998 RepID=UPI0003630551|nr:M12 family metallo-peptidase [Neolewinella persica]
MKSNFYSLRNAFALLTIFCLSTFASGQSINLLQPVSNKASVSTLVDKELVRYGIFEVDAENYSQLLADAPDSWNLTLPATAGINPEMTLRLERNTFLRTDFRLRRASDGKAVPNPNLGLHYFGQVAGDAKSKVALSLLDGEMTATITYAGGERLALGKMQRQSNKNSAISYIVFPDAQLAEKQEFDCGTADTGIPYTAEELDYTAKSQSTVGCVDIYFEIDYDVFFDKGSVTAAAQHLAANFNEVAILYAEIDVNLKISEILVWDEISPYFGTTSSAMLTQFQSQRTSFNGDLAQLISYQASGGIAVLDGLCHPFNAARMSFSSIHPNFAAVPVYSWTTMVISHELGHLLGSQHTHACVWNGNNTAIDGCAGLTEGLCGTPGIPTNGGTIMSYCHLRPQGINFDFGFGPQPSAVIANRVASAQGCVQAVCDSGGGGGNGGGDDDDDDDVAEPISCDQQTVYVNVTLDDFGMETMWKIRTETGTVLATGGPYPKKQKGRIIRDTVCVTDGCYVFEISDLDGDGICCAYGQGRYELRDSSGTVIVNNTRFDTLAVADFCLPEVAPGDDDDDDENECPVIDFVEYPVVTYGTNQDGGQFSLLPGNKGIKLENNAWKAVVVDYTMTEDTWVSFWFRSTMEGEVHGIGMDNNEVLSSNLTFRLYGTQGWGIGDFNTYPGDGAWRFYQIPIGQFYSLEAKYLFFTADHDVGTGDGNSFFRDVVISEGAPCGNPELPETDLPETNDRASLGLTPNPANYEINVSLPAALIAGPFHILDLNGRTVLSGEAEAQNFRVPVGKLKSGTYVLRAGGESRRFVVAR